MKFFKQWSGIKPPLGWDTKLVDYVLTGNPEASRGLKYLARRKLFAPAYDEDITFDGSTDIEDMAVYNGRDASATLQLYHLQKEGEDIWRSADLANHLYEVTDMLVDSELHGAPIKEQWLKDKKEELETGKEHYQKIFDELELNPRSPKQVREYFGTKSSDKEALEALNSPIAKTILEFRAITKELSTYVDGFSEHIVNGRVHTNYIVPGTLTGRLASRNPNMMNLKSDDDEEKNYQLVVDTSEPDKKILHFDYSQIEMRKMAVECLDKRLLDIFIGGRDIHDELQREIFGDEYDVESKSQRVHAKTTNFGTIYGISPYGLSKLLKTDEQQAQRYLKTWYGMYPAVSTWQNEIKNRVRKDKFVQTQFGRMRRVDLEYLVVYEDAIFRECINYPIQSESCDIYLKAALAIWRETGLYPIQFVHDELVYELASEDLDGTIDYICWKMKRVAEDLTGHIVPFPVEAK
jgi:DNA polymerase-1